MKKKNVFGYTLIELTMAMTLFCFLSVIVFKWLPKRGKEDRYLQGFRQIEAYFQQASSVFFQDKKMMLEITRKDKNEKIPILVVPIYDRHTNQNILSFVWPSVHSQEWYVWQKNPENALPAWEHLTSDQKITPYVFVKWVLKDKKQNILEEFIFLND